MSSMDVDFTTAPEAFAKANAEARLAYLRSLTSERAARDVEEVLELAEEIYRSSKEANLPPPLPNPLPGPTLAILLGWKPSAEDEGGGRKEAEHP
jgi:hypothetical protein